MFVVIGVVGVAVLAANLLLGDLVPGVGDAVPSDLLSTEAIGAFVAALGFGGAVAHSTGAPEPLPWGVGIALGVVLAWAAGRLTRVVHGGSSGATTSTVDTVGCHGRVVSAIPVGGRGVVSVVVGGRAVRLDAVADGPLPAGAAVRVTGVLSPTAVTVRAAATGRP
jgi:membrane protein implicated in regulation of membrane protease activity